MVGSAVARALVILPEAVGHCATTGGKRTGPFGFTDFAGQRPRAQRSIPGDLIFGSFYQEKEQSLPAAIEPGKPRARRERSAF
jgi:hypothetical protein